jgi:hypothetical protein
LPTLLRAPPRPGEFVYRRYRTFRRVIAPTERFDDMSAEKRRPDQQSQERKRQKKKKIKGAGNENKVFTYEELLGEELEDQRLLIAH